MGVYKRDFFCYNPSRSTPYGPVVQSVSTPACHAGGRRFESVPGRQKSSHPIRGGCFFDRKGGLESRLLATCRWQVATGVAFPQKSESVPGRHEKDHICLSGKCGLFRMKRVLRRMKCAAHMKYPSDMKAPAGARARFASCRTKCGASWRKRRCFMFAEQTLH